MSCWMGMVPKTGRRRWSYRTAISPSSRPGPPVACMHFRDTDASSPPRAACGRARSPAAYLPLASPSPSTQRRHRAGGGANWHFPLAKPACPARMGGFGCSTAARCSGRAGAHLRFLRLKSENGFILSVCRTPSRFEPRQGVVGSATKVQGPEGGRGGGGQWADYPMGVGLAEPSRTGRFYARAARWHSGTRTAGRPGVERWCAAGLLSTGWLGGRIGGSAPVVQGPRRRQRAAHEPEPGDRAIQRHMAPFRIVRRRVFHRASMSPLSGRRLRSLALETGTPDQLVS